MTTQRVRTPGNNPQTRIYCDWTDRQGGGCPTNVNPVSDWDAKDARRRAKALGWRNKGKYDYCEAHAPEWAQE